MEEERQKDRDRRLALAAQRKAQLEADMAAQRELQREQAVQAAQADQDAEARRRPASAVPRGSESGSNLRQRPASAVTRAPLKPIGDLQSRARQKGLHRFADGLERAKGSYADSGRPMRRPCSAASLGTHAAAGMPYARQRPVSALPTASQPQLGGDRPLRAPSRPISAPAGSSSRLPRRNEVRPEAPAAPGQRSAAVSGLLQDIKECSLKRPPSASRFPVKVDFTAEKVITQWPSADQLHDSWSASRTYVVDQNSPRAPPFDTVNFHVHVH